MASLPSSTRRRHPDEIVSQSQASDDESQELISRVRLYDEIVPDSQDSASSDYDLPPRKLRRRRTGWWSVLRDRVRDAMLTLLALFHMQQVRVLIFVHTSDARLCLDVRLCAVMRWKKIGWTALLRCARTNPGDLESDLDALWTLVKEDLRSETDPDVRARKAKAQDDRIDEMLSRVVAHVLCGHVREYRPLLAKLSVVRCRRLAKVFDGRRLNTLGQAVDVLSPKPWFRFQTQTNAVHRAQSLQELGENFNHISKWPCEEAVHESKCGAFDTKTQRQREVSNLTGTINMLKCDHETHADDIEMASALRKEMVSKDKLMMQRMRKYQLFPTAEQRRQLLGFMGTCRWTYNQAIAHFRATNVSKAETLRDLYVTESTKNTRVYPDGMELPPQWAFNASKTIRYNTLRKFQTNVESAFSNEANVNIEKFKIQFKSRKKGGRYFTFCEDAVKVKITYPEGEPRAMLSISKLKNIPIRCDRGMEITNTNGFWYAVIPRFVRPDDYVNHGRTIALDPGMEAFMTGVDLDGNALHIGRGTRERLDKYRTHISDAQQEMSLIKSCQGHRSGRQWRAFARAKRALNCATVKLNNCVKEMHYQTCAHLTKHYDTIILPIFSSKDMIKKSTSRDHTFNRLLLGFKHFQFRKLLQAKCETMGKSLVVCSEMLALTSATDDANMKSTAEDWREEREDSGELDVNPADTSKILWSPGSAALYSAGQGPSARYSVTSDSANSEFELIIENDGWDARRSERTNWTDGTNLVTEAPVCDLDENWTVGDTDTTVDVA